MTKLLLTTFIFWQLPWLGKQLYPELFGSEYIQWPCFFIFCVLVPYGFSKALFLRKKLESIVYLGVFLVNIGILILGNNAFMIASKSVEMITSSDNTMVGKLFSAPLIAASETKRKLAAKIIYSKYGIAVHYQTDKGKLIQYIPSGEAYNLLEKNKASDRIGIKLKEFNYDQAKQIFYLSLVQLVTFFIVFTLRLFFVTKYTVDKKLK